MSNDRQAKRSPNMLQKIYVQTLQASFAMQTLGVKNKEKIKCQ